MISVGVAEWTAAWRVFGIDIDIDGQELDIRVKLREQVPAG